MSASVEGLELRIMGLGSVVEAVGDWSAWERSGKGVKNGRVSNSVL